MLRVSEHAIERYRQRVADVCNVVRRLEKRGLLSRVGVGRVKWISDSPFTGKDNCCWYLFDGSSQAATQFIGRAA